MRKKPIIAMNKIYYLTSLIILLSCSPAKNNETAADSTQNIVTDTVAAHIEESSTSSPTVETAELLSDITKDSLVAEMTNRMTELAQAYDTIQYNLITSSYSWERPYCYPSQEGPCIDGTEADEETKEWLFDRFNRLRSYSRKMKSAGNETTISSLYLFSNDSLIAVSERKVDNSDGGVTSQVTILAGKCPRCGITAIEYGDASYINEEELAAKQQEFYESMPELINALKAGRKKARWEDDYDFIFSINRTKEGNADEKSEAITYSVEFRVSKEAYSNYISKQ
jgi:hypothetical protein